MPRVVDRVRKDRIFLPYFIILAFLSHAGFILLNASWSISAKVNATSMHAIIVQLVLMKIRKGRNAKLHSTKFNDNSPCLGLIEDEIKVFL